MKRSDWLKNSKQQFKKVIAKDGAGMEKIQRMMQEGLLKVNELDPEKAYVFTMGNEHWMPSTDELRAFSELIGSISGDSKFPYMVLTGLNKVEETTVNDVESEYV